MNQFPHVIWTNEKNWSPNSLDSEPDGEEYFEAQAEEEDEIWVDCDDDYGEHFDEHELSISQCLQANNTGTVRPPRKFCLSSLILKHLDPILAGSVLTRSRPLWKIQLSGSGLHAGCPCAGTIKPGFQLQMLIGGTRMLLQTPCFLILLLLMMVSWAMLVVLWLSFTQELQAISPRFIPCLQSHKFLALCRI